MPIALVWNSDEHWHHAPKIFKYLWIVAVVCTLMSVAIVVPRLCQHFAAGSRRANTAQHDAVRLPQQTRSAMLVLCTPLICVVLANLYLYVPALSNFWHLLVGICTTLALWWTLDTMLDILGEGPDLTTNIGNAAAQRWWPFRGEERLTKTCLRIAQGMVRLFALFNCMAALLIVAVAGAGHPGIRIVRVGGFCDFMHVMLGIDWSHMWLHVVRLISALLSLMCTLGLTVVRRGVIAAFGNNPGLQNEIKWKHCSVSLLSIVIGWLPICATFSARIAALKYATPTLELSNMKYVGSFGCPVYDEQVMAAALYATMLAVAMVPVSLLMTCAYKPSFPEPGAPAAAVPLVALVAP